MTPTIIRESLPTLTIELSDEPTAYMQFRYPAGEWQVRFPSPLKADRVRIIAHLRNAEDMMRLALLRNAVRNAAGDVICDLYLPYLPYARADRRFSSGDCCGLEVFCQQIRAMGFDSVTSLDVHNRERAQNFMHNLIDRSPELFINRSIADFARRHSPDSTSAFGPATIGITVLFPDEGARTRYQIDPKVFESNIGRIEITVLHCSKKRNAETGKMEGFVVPDIPVDQPAIIIDDICDGGATFIGIAQEISRQQTIALPKLGLYVTHGIFSKGIDILHGRLNGGLFDHIYTTDSMGRDSSTADFLTIWKCMPVMFDPTSIEA